MLYCISNVEAQTSITGIHITKNPNKFKLLDLSPSPQAREFSIFFCISAKGV